MSEVIWLEHFSENLIALMTECGVTQKQLAEDTGLSESTINRYVKGLRIPKATALINISTALNCSLEELIDFGEDIDF